MSYDNDIEHEPWRSSEYGNLALVRAVKQRPCLYNNTIPEYSMKEVTRTAWQEIADEFGCSAKILKRQWQRLRTAFHKDLRKRKYGGKKKKHFLANHMEFILPYMVQSRQEELKTCLQGKVFEVIQDNIADKKDEKDKKPVTGIVELQQELQSAISELREMNSGPTVAEPSPKKPKTVVDSVSNMKGIFKLNKELQDAIDELKTLDTANQYDVPNCFSEESNGQGTYDLYDTEPSTKFVSSLPSSPAYYQPYSDADSRETAAPETVRASTSYNRPLIDGKTCRENYILSLLPEIEDFSESQFQIFKRKMFILLDNVKRRT